MTDQITAPPPLPLPTKPWSETSQPRAGLPSRDFGLYMQAFDKIMRLVASAVGAIGNDSVLTTVGGLVLTGGFTWQLYDFGSVVSGSITPEPINGLKQTVTNNGSFEIDPPTGIGDVELHVTNGATPGTISFGAFTKNFTGDALTTNVGDKFVIFIYGWNALGADYLIKARQ